MILTVDPGLIKWAYAVFDDEICVESNTISYPTKPKLSQEHRLYDIFVQLQEPLTKYPIEHIVVERQFVDIMQQITGVCRSAAGVKNLPTTLLVPTSWRKLLTGNGKASEELIKQFVVEKYPSFDTKNEHEIDCVALYLAYRNKNGKTNARGNGTTSRTINKVSAEGINGVRPKKRRTNKKK